MARKIVTTGNSSVSSAAVKTAGCKGCKPAPWEKEVSCTGVNCPKNLPFLAKEWDAILLREQREAGYASIGEIRRMEGRVEAAEVAHEGGLITEEELSGVIAQLEGMKLIVPVERSTMPRWTAVAEMHPPNLQGITLEALVSARGHMKEFAARCEMLRKEQHPAAAAKCARIKAGLETGNFKAIWARAKAAQAVYQSRKVLAKSADAPLSSAIWAAEQAELREYEAGYRVVKGEGEEGAYLFPELSPNLDAVDLQEMTKSPVSAKVLQARRETLAHLAALDGYRFTDDYPVPEVREEELVAY